LLHTSIELVRFPTLYHLSNDEVPRTKTTNANEAGGPAMSKDARKKERQARLPEGGGPYKGFAFVVVGDDAAAEKLRTAWSWEPKAAIAPAAAESDDSSSDDSSDSDSSESGADKEEAKAAPPAEANRAERNWEAEASKAGLRALPM
jgi:hypothetical protein